MFKRAKEKEIVIDVTERFKDRLVDEVCLGRWASSRCFPFLCPLSSHLVRQLFHSSHCLAFALTAAC